MMLRQPKKMAKAILQYIEQKDNFDDTVLAISNSIMMQRARMIYLTD